MDVILKYILANYTWILIGSIIILLAIIGWYADKTNFGQGKKNTENKDNDNININDLKKELGNKKLLDEISGGQSAENNGESITSQTTNSTPINLEQNIGANNDVVQPIQSKESFQTVQMNFDPITGEPLNKNIVSNENAILNNTTSNVTQDNIVGIENKTQHNENLEEKVNVLDDNLQLKQPDIVFDENLENFEKQFNEIIPEKEIIDEGLLEDIESLTLDKTQKIDLSDIPDLDDLDLPRIKQIKTNDEGIWKF